jgi:hypothetical protein
MIRAILYADDESYRITGYRRLSPITNIPAERRFLEAATRLFSSGTAPKKFFFLSFSFFLLPVLTCKAGN